MDVILATVGRKYALVYLTDVFVCLKTPSQHIEQAATVLRLMKSARLILKLKKSFFISNAIHYLGHTIRLGLLKVATKTTDAIYGFKPPPNTSELRFFLGCCNVYGRLLPVSVLVAAPLNANLNKGEQKSFELLN